jgi:HEAT repeat protein
VRPGALRLALAGAALALARPASAAPPGESDAAVVVSPRHDAAARAAAARRLGEAPPRGREAALGALLVALDDRSADVRREVVLALERLRDERVMPRLERRLAVEEDAGVSAALLLAIGTTGGRYAVPVLLPRCDDPRVRVRAAAATALGDLGGEVARQRLLRMLRDADDPDWTVRSAAMLGLARCGRPCDAGVILEAYREGGGESRWLARASLARAVGALDADAVPVLDRLMADPDARVAAAAGAALVRSGRTDEVLRRLGDPRPGVRAAAAAACAEIPSSASRLREVAVRDRDRAVRWSAALALSLLDDPVSDALLVEGVASDDPAVSWAAVAECRRKTGADVGLDPDEWRRLLDDRRRARK